MFAIFAALATALPLPSHADNWGGPQVDTDCPTDVGRADGTYHTFYFIDVEQNMREATHSARHDNLDPTDINTAMDADLDANTDVVLQQRNYQTGFCGMTWHADNEGIIGLTTCYFKSSSGDCTRHDVYYDGSWTSNATSQGARDVLACHEVGHTVGLRHQSSSCMQKDIGYGPHWSYYDDHDRYMINSHY